MGTGFFAGIFSIVGLWRYWGEPEWKWFLILIVISKLFTEAVRSDFEKNGIENSNKKLTLVAQILQIFVIIRGVQSIFFA